MNAKSHAANSQHLLEHSSMLCTEPTSLYVPALIPPFKVTSLKTFPGLHCPAIVGFTSSDFCPWAMRPFGVWVEDGPAWFGPRKPLGCGLTLEVKFGVKNASDLLSAKATNHKYFSCYLAWWVSHNASKQWTGHFEVEQGTGTRCKFNVIER